MIFDARSNRILSMPNAPCPMPHAPCPMPHAQCPIPHSQFAKLATVASPNCYIYK
ncbi:MAG: hypothetical protein KME31_08650 [Tolypothrix carrinoi HA7290-LM1]|nr:hypothetical protein [Tolypothrix carrinoi HA7290-LM1]